MIRIRNSERVNKIIFVHFYNNYSGSPRILESIINSVTKKECILITNNTEGFLSNLKIKKLIFKFKLSKSSFITLIRYFFAQFNIFYLILRYAKKSDLLYINTTIPMFASFAGRIKGSKILFHLHEDRSSLNYIHRFLSEFRKYSCDIEVFVSNYLFEKEHISNKQSYVVPNIISEKLLEESKKHNTLKERNTNFNVLMICSLKKYKGILEFIEIANKLVYYIDIKFLLVVGDGQKEIDIFFNGINIPVNVKIFEKTDDVTFFYKSASLLLNLSRPDEWIESFGLTILEGMSFGLPCIVPPVGGPSELVEDGINGYKISSYETELIASKILSIYKDQALQNKIFENNRIKASIYNFNVFQEQLNMIVNEAFK